MDKKELAFGVGALLVLIGLLWYGGRVGVPDVKTKNASADAVQFFIEEVRKTTIAKVGQPIEGFEPFMFIEAFSGIAGSDFDGVEAELGVYYVENGEVKYRETEPQLHTAARAVTDDGMKTLLENIGSRLNMDVESQIDVRQILEIISKPETALVPDATPVPDGSTNPGSSNGGTGGYVCTMDAKLCPDGSAVGRFGPRCEFAFCPGETVKGFRTCPDEWIVNKMPGVVGDDNPREYYIIDGKRWEISQFDRVWVENKCNLAPQEVY